VPVPPYIAYLRGRVGHITLLMPAAAAIIRDEHGHVLVIEIRISDAVSGRQAAYIR
jgi:hypothetical protein